MKISKEEHENLRRAQLKNKLARKERLTSDPNPADVGRERVRMISKEDKVHAGAEPKTRGKPIRSQRWAGYVNGPDNAGGREEN